MIVLTLSRTSWVAAPVLVVCTETVGMSIFGKRSTPSVKKEKPPTTVRIRIMTVAKTGRRTQISASFCITQLLFDPRPFVELLKVTGGNHLVSLDAGQNLYEVALF